MHDPRPPSLDPCTILPNITTSPKAGNRIGIPPLLNHDPENAKQSAPPTGSRTEAFQAGELPACWCRINGYRVVPNDDRLPVAQI
jgi:hypothetical protein